MMVWLLVSSSELSLLSDTTLSLVLSCGLFFCSQETVFGSANLLYKFFRCAANNYEYV